MLRLFDRRRGWGRRGSVLLEAMIALTVLGITISTVAWMASEALATLSRARAAEAEVRRADRLMTAASLWPREDLDLRLGTTVQGPWIMRIDRLTTNLYEVTLLPPEPAAVPLLRTTVFRGAREEDP